MSKKIKVNKYCKNFACINFLNNEKKKYNAYFKFFPFLRKKLKGLEYYSYITVSNNQYKKLITLEKGGPAPSENTENNVHESRCGETYGRIYKKKNFDDFEDDINDFEDDVADINDWYPYPFDEQPNIIINDKEINDILDQLFDRLENKNNDENDDKNNNNK